MAVKKIIPCINAENEVEAAVLRAAQKYSLEDADGLFLYDYSTDDSAKEAFLATVKKVAKRIDIPFSVGIKVSRFEDVKKALYTGATHVVIRQGQMPEQKVLAEAVERFGRDKIVVEIDMSVDFKDSTYVNALKEEGICAVLLKHVEVTGKFKTAMEQSALPIYVRDSLCRNDLSELLSVDSVCGVMTNYFEEKDMRPAKVALKEQGIEVRLLESAKSFDDFKLLENGLLPVVAQDYQTGEVLMVAYMNKDAYEQTIRTGKMTYYSRSRQELWCKGDTSGHYQYVKSLMIDCDSDTILAKVHQIGAACHTGKRSCFFTDLARTDYIDYNPSHVLQEDYNIIKERKEHPKEGSYTNYLFDKGIDKILKKCGEEATEICIAAKNPDAEELKYEIADYLYHLMVLMVECGLDWEDIMKELTNRRK